MPSVPTCARLSAAALLVPALACSPPTSAPVGAAAPRPRRPPSPPAISASGSRSSPTTRCRGARRARRGNVKGTDYIAAEARRIGLQPAGDGGGYFQTMPLVARTLVSAARASPPGRHRSARTPTSSRATRARAPARSTACRWWTAACSATARTPALPAEAAAGKLVVIRMAPDSTGGPTGMVNRAARDPALRSARPGSRWRRSTTWGRTDRGALAATGAELAKPGAPEAPAFMYVTGKMADALLAAGTVRGTVAFVDGPPAAPARNVVAILPGSDPALRGQLVAVGAHNDHIGMAPEPAEHDSLRAFDRVMRPARRRGHARARRPPSRAAAIRTILDSLRRARPPGRTRSSTAPTTTAAAR